MTMVVDYGAQSSLQTEEKGRGEERREKKKDQARERRDTSDEL